jgi:hypothetical protein
MVGDAPEVPPAPADPEAEIAALKAALDEPLEKL